MKIQEGTTSVLVNETASLYDQAVEVVIQYNQASASFLQRRLRIGYNRAANLIEEMEQKGVAACSGIKAQRDLC